MIIIQGNIKNYLDGIADNLPAEIIPAETYDQIYRMASLLSDFAASEYIMETHLGTEVPQVDFSWRVLTREKACLVNGLNSSLAADAVWSKINNVLKFWPPEIADIWFEMDYGEYEKPLPQPCFFFNATQIKKGTYIDEQLLSGALKPLLDYEQLQALWPLLGEVIRKLPAQTGLFQVGVMLARNTDRVRIFTSELTREQTREYLSNISWKGSFSELGVLFQLVHTYSDGQYILDFDVSADGISEKIGINFGLGQKESLPAFLHNLIEHQLCTHVKGKGVLAWSGSKGSFLGPDYGYAALIKNISHFKISLLPEKGLAAKAYLRIAGIYFKELFAVKARSQDKKQVQAPAGPSYKEMQNIFKQIAQKSMLDLEYRELCLKDSKAAIQKVAQHNTAIPDNIVFLEEDGDSLHRDGIAYILPPFLKPSWLTSKSGSGSCDK